MSDKLVFLPAAGASRSHVEAVVARNLGGRARVEQGQRQGKEGFFIHTPKTASQSVLEDIRSEVKYGRRSERSSDSRKDRTSDYMESDLPTGRHRPASDLSNTNRSQSYGMSPPPKPEHRAVANNDGDPLSRHTSHAESAYGREYPDGDSVFGSLPSPYVSPTGQRRPSMISQDSSDSFDEMYGCPLSAPSGGRHSFSNSSRDRHQSSRYDQGRHRK